MLVLSRKVGEGIVLPDQDVAIRVLRIAGGQVRLGIAASAGIPSPSHRGLAPHSRSPRDWRSPRTGRSAEVPQWHRSPEEPELVNALPETLLPVQAGLKSDGGGRCDCCKVLNKVRLVTRPTWGAAWERPWSGPC